jgi:hypothetical protein
MKKISYCSAAVILALSALSCNRQVEVETPQPAVGSLTFRAVLEQPVTKADLSNYAVVWQAGDQIAVYNGSEWVTSDPLEASAIQNNGRYAEFSVSIAEAAGYWAVYPASAAPDAAISGDDIPVVLPAVQVIASGNSVAKDALVQVCKTADKDNMVFKNVTSLIEFKVPESGIDYVCFEALDGDAAAMNIVGAASVDAGEPAAVVTGDASRVTVKGSFTSGENYFAVVYPQSAVNKFRFVFSKTSSEDGTSKAFRTGSTGSALEFPLNSGCKFSDFGTLSWIGPISTKADLDKWAKYAAWWTADEVIKLGADIDYESGSWKPVNGDDATGFAGVLDGQGHSIFGIKFDYTTGEHIGFFSDLASSEKRLRVKDLKLGYDSSSSTGYNDSNCVLQVATANTKRFGALAGTCTNCVIDNVHNYVRTILGYAATSTIVFGGIIGETDGQCEFNECSNNNTIACIATAVGTYIGGLIGQAKGVCSINSCINKGDIKRTKVSGTEGSGVIILGGIIGRTANNTKGHSINQCINYGGVSTSANTKPKQLFLGGIAGIDGESPDETPNLIINHCRNEGNISSKGVSKAGTHGTGGIVGAFNYNSQILNSTNLGTIVKNGNHNGVEGKFGGIVGFITQETALIHNCINGAQGDNTKGAIQDLIEQTAETNQRLGGIVGHANIGTVRGCINYAPVSSNGTAAKTYVGGIAGNATTGKVVSCENYGTITVEGTTDTHSAGGIIGLQNGSKTENHTGENCIVKASVSCGYAGNAGLIVGRFSNSVNTTWGTSSEPAIVKSGCSVNGLDATSSNFESLLAGSDYGITASGLASGYNTIWAVFQ